MRLLFLTILFLPLLAFGQKLDKKAGKFLEQGNIAEATEIYLKLSQKFPENANYFSLLGDCMTKQNNSAKAVEYYEKAKSLDNNPTLYSKLMNAYMRNGEFIKAIDMATNHINANPSEPNKELKRLISKSKIGQTLVAHPLTVEINNLGSSINSKGDDILPYLSANGEMLVFSSNRKQASGKKSKSGTKPFEVYQARGEDGELKSLKAFSSPVNSEKTDLAMGMSASSNTIYVFQGNELKSGSTRGYTLNGNSYQLKKEDFENLKGYELNNGITISEDGQELYFSSRHSSAIGGLDIFLSKKLPNGKWGEPIRLDENINTVYDECFPQLAQFDNYLYFSSDGHPGMGGLDLFKSKRSDENWKKPVNLGYPLSTPLDDKNIAINHAGNLGYISSVGEDSHGGYDIYSFEFKAATIKHAVMLVYLNSSNGKVITDVPISITDENGNNMGTYYANQNTKRYTLALKPGKYELNIEEDAYSNYSKKIVVSPENLNKFNNEIRLTVVQ